MRLLDALFRRKIAVGPDAPDAFYRHPINLHVELPVFNGREMSKARGQISQGANRQRGEKARHRIIHFLETQIVQPA